RTRGLTTAIAWFGKLRDVLVDNASEVKIRVVGGIGWIVPLENVLEQSPTRRVLLEGAWVEEQKQNSFLVRIDKIARELQILRGGGLNKPRRYLTAVHLEGLGRGISIYKRRRVVVARVLDTIPSVQEIRRNRWVVDDQAVVGLGAETGG